MELTMRRMTVFLPVLAVCAALARLSAQAPALPTIEQVLEKYLTASGGKAAFDKITTRVATATLEMPDQGINGTMTLTEKAPNKSLAVVDIAGLGKIREAVDGTVAWDDNPQMGLREKTGAEKAEALRGATFNMETNIQKVFPKLVVTGREQVGTRPTIVVVGTPVEGAPTTFYFDAETGLLVKSSGSRESPQGPMNFEAFFEDYRTQDGIKQPFLIRQVTPAFTMVIRVTDMKHNVPVDDSIFKKPGIN
jgi:hypothetical protein